MVVQFAVTAGGATEHDIPAPHFVAVPVKFSNSPQRASPEQHADTPPHDQGSFAGQPETITLQEAKDEDVDKVQKNTKNKTSNIILFIISSLAYML